MKLHDPDTEKELIRIARRLAGPTGFQKPGFAFWIDLIWRALAFAPLIWLAAMAIAATYGNDSLIILSQAICAILLMALVRVGMGQVAMSFKTACFFGTLANLPITGRTALTLIRGIILRRFWLPAMLGSLPIAIYLHNPGDPGRFPEFLATLGLLAAIVWATLGIIQFPLVHRLRLVKIWHWVAYILIAYFVVMYLFGARLVTPSASREAMESLIDRIMWIFPPVWVFPGKIGNGGLIPAVSWIALGFWNWLRWPASAFPNYDRPYDILGAFGDAGKSRDEMIEPEESTPLEQTIILSDPPTRPPSNGWVERLIAASIPAADLATAGAFMPETKHTSRANQTMFFAAVWLLVLGFGKTPNPGEQYRDLVVFVTWAVPSFVFIIGLLSILNPLKDALRPCPVGNTPVPFFTTLPIPLRSLLRLTFRITIVRTVIAVAIATPFFCILAKIHQLPEVGAGIVAMIPAIGAAWIFSVPALISNRLDPHLRRRKGIFPLILATSLAQVPIGFLWIIGSIAGIGLSFTWGMGGTAGQYAFLLLPAAIACLVLGGIMSRLLFETLHLSLRQRRYDWKSKIR